MKPCPFCAESIQDAAIKCRYCGSLLVPEGMVPEGALGETPAPGGSGAASPSVPLTWVAIGGVALVVAVAAVVMLLRLPAVAPAPEEQAERPRAAVPHRLFGIAWGTPANEVAAQLASRGFRFTEEDEEGDHVFQGDIDGHPAVVVAMLSRGALAKTIVIMVGADDPQGLYAETNRRLTAEYGPPDRPNGGAAPVTRWSSDEAERGTRLWTTITDRGDVAIHYESDQWPAEARRRRSESTADDSGVESKLSVSDARAPASG